MKETCPQAKLVDNEILDIMDKMLTINPNSRPSAQQLLDDPFFAELNGKDSVVALPVEELLEERRLSETPGIS